VPELFAVPFARLALDDLARFLEGAEREPLLWEAKGNALSPHEVRRQCGGFANSNQGGYLVLGASETGGGWTLDGVAFPDGEPHRYISSCLQEGVRPAPFYDVRAFDVGHGRHVAVVEVKPLAAGPCIVRGTVYERVAGATVPVKDPARLADLFAGGARAHERARAAADAGTQAGVKAFEALRDDETADEGELPPSLFVVLAVAPVAPDPGLTTRLFRESTRNRMDEAAERLARSPHPIGPQIWPRVQQDRRVTIARSVLPYEPDWVVTASWDGAVAVGARQPAQSGSPETIVTDAIAPAYEAAVDLVRVLGGAGPGYVRLAVVDPQDPRWHLGVRIARGPNVLDLDALDMPSVRRELSRAVGIDLPEPEGGLL
jgi:hypothetical protein